MRRLPLLYLFACAILSTGCLAFAAGAAGGALVASDDEDIERYIDTHEVEPRIAKAMYEGEIVEGMTKEQVKVMMGETQYDCEEREVTKSDVATSKWVCENDDPKWIGRHIIRFQDDRVLSHDTENL
jgi:hypothetical protein